MYRTVHFDSTDNQTILYKIQMFVTVITKFKHWKISCVTSTKSKSKSRVSLKFLSMSVSPHNFCRVGLIQVTASETTLIQENDSGYRLFAVETEILLWTRYLCGCCSLKPKTPWVFGATTDLLLSDPSNKQRYSRPRGRRNFVAIHLQRCFVQTPKCAADINISLW
jgi:hypothetical protein